MNFSGFPILPTSSLNRFFAISGLRLILLGGLILVFAAYLSFQSWQQSELAAAHFRSWENTQSLSFWVEDLKDGVTSPRQPSFVPYPIPERKNALRFAEKELKDAEEATKKLKDQLRDLSPWSKALELYWWSIIPLLGFGMIMCFWGMVSWHKDDADEAAIRLLQNRKLELEIEVLERGVSTHHLEIERLRLETEKLQLDVLSLRRSRAHQVVSIRKP